MFSTTRVPVTTVVSLLAGMGLAGCVSATSTDVAEQDPATSSAPGSVQAQSCDLLTADYLRSELATTFRDGRPLHGSTQQRTECQWTSQSRTAIVNTVVDEDGDSYGDARRDAQRGLGLVTDVDIPKAKRAFEVPGYGMTGMLIDGKYVQVVVAVPGASAEDFRDIAETAAASVASQD